MVVPHPDLGNAARLCLYAAGRGGGVWAVACAVGQEREVTAVEVEADADGATLHHHLACMAREAAAVEGGRCRLGQIYSGLGQGQDPNLFQG